MVTPLMKVWFKCVFKIASKECFRQLQLSAETEWSQCSRYVGETLTHSSTHLEIPSIYYRYLLQLLYNNYIYLDQSQTFTYEGQDFEIYPYIFCCFCIVLSFKREKNISKNIN